MIISAEIDLFAIHMLISTAVFGLFAIGCIKADRKIEKDWWKDGK